MMCALTCPCLLQYIFTLFSTDERWIHVDSTTYHTTSASVCFALHRRAILKRVLQKFHFFNVIQSTETMFPLPLDFVCTLCVYSSQAASQDSNVAIHLRSILS